MAHTFHLYGQIISSPKLLIRCHYFLLLVANQTLAIYGTDLACPVKLTVSLWLYPYTVKNNTVFG